MRPSFAQNAEDVLLWRCFAGTTNGFYIDVGASSPINDSVTQSFYESGWHGINVEPIPERVLELDYARPRDINICAAAGQNEDTIVLTRTPGIGGLSTIASGGQAHNGAWHFACKQKTLNAILLENSIQKIDFLKIDVEGSEEQVLRGLDLKIWRPTIILLESTLPLSTEESYQNWDLLLIGSNYNFVWFDGLNRYYIEQSHFQRLSIHFRTQPNVFDNFFTYGSGGHPLTNASHPDHWFSKHLAITVFRALGQECEDFLLKAFCKDISPNILEGSVSPDVFETCFHHVLGRYPNKMEMDYYQDVKIINGRTLILALIKSDEFRNLRTRMAISPFSLR